MSLRVFKQFFSQKRIAGGALVLAITQFGASVAGLMRDRILASTFPPGTDSLDVVSVYIAAFRPSDLLFQITVMSAFSVALVPLLASHLAHGRREEMNRLLTSTLIVTSLFFGLLSALLALFLPILAPLLVNFQGERLVLYIHFAQLACLTNLLFVVGNALGQYLVTEQKYWMYGLTPILYTLGTIGGTLWLTASLGPYGPMAGTILGAVLYTILRFFASVRQGWRVHFSSSSIFHPEIMQMGWLMLPRILALGATQVQLLLFDTIASGLPLGSVTINAYARNFQAAAVGVIGIALAQSVFSPLSQAMAKGDIGRFFATVKKTSILMLALTIPASFALIALTPTAASLVHLTSPAVYPTFTVTLMIYALSIPFESMGHLLLRGSYATKHTAIPAVLSVVTGILTVVIAWLWTGTYGVAALAWGFLIGQAIELLLLWFFLQWRVRGLTAQ